MFREKEMKAASDLENLVPAIKEMVSRIHDGTENQPYSAVYWLRREMSRIVATLGAGQPNTNKVEEYYRKQMQND